MYFYILFVVVEWDINAVHTNDILEVAHFTQKDEIIHFSPCNHHSDHHPIVLHVDFSVWETAHEKRRLH